jgi:hypothetical protein
MSALILVAAALGAAQADQPVIVGPPGRSVDVVDGGTLAVDIKEDEPKLSATWSWSDMEREVGESGLRLTRRSYRIGLELPVGGGSNIASRETIDALDNGPSLSASVTLFGTTSRDRFDSPAFQRIMQRARNRCAEDPAHEMSADACAAYRPERAFAIRYSGLGEGAVNRTLLSPAYALGIEGSVGVNRFKYRQGATLTEASERKVQFSGKLFLSLFPADGLSMLTLSGEYQNAWEALDDKILCPPVVSDPNEQCTKASPGAPQQVEKLLVAADYRQVLGYISRVGEVATSPKATFDVLSDEFEFELPLYLKPSKDIGFMPGVSVSYNSTKDKVGFGFFLKQAFSF